MKRVRCVVNDMADNDIPQGDTAVDVKTSSAFADVGQQPAVQLIIDDNQHDYARKVSNDIRGNGSLSSSVHGVFAVGTEAEDSEMEDTHHCAKCNIEFKSLEAYIKHKLSTDKCKVSYSRKRHKLIPKIIQGGLPDVSQSKKPKYTGKKKGPKQPHVASAHNLTDILTESEKSQYRCEICGKSFGRSAALRWHVDHEHQKKDSDEDILSSEADDEEETQEYQPPQMDFQGNDNVDKNGSHITVVFGDGDTNASATNNSSEGVVCHICDRKMKDQHVLKAHMLTHSSVRAFRCSFEGCNYAFRTKGSMKRHMRRHTGERPYKCNLCMRTFTESGALTRHLKARVSCTTKSSEDFPRYGKRKPLDQNAADSDTIQDYEVIDEDGKVAHVLSLKHESTSDLADIPDVPKGTTLIAIAPTSSENTGEINPIESQVSEMTCATFACQVCAESFSAMDGLLGHLKMHIGSCPLKCGLCNYASQDVNDFLAHLALPDHTSVATDSVTVVEINHPVEGNAVAADHSELITEGIAPAEELPGELSLDAMDSYVVQENDCSVDKMESKQDQMDGVVFVETNIEKEVSDKSNGAHIDQSTEIINENDGVESTCEDLEKHEELELVGSDFESKANSDENITSVKAKDEEQTDSPQEAVVIQVADYNENETDGKMLADDTPDAAAEDAQHADVVSLALQQLLELFSVQKNTTSEQQDDKKSMLYTCPICFRNMKAAAYLKLHMKTHLMKKQHTCHICQHTFNGKDALNKHVITHSNTRNYKCGECGKFFKRISHVREHLRVHSENRPYLCTVCLKSFKSANACRVHMRTHTQVLPYSCEHCGKQFREKASLDRHIRSHTGEKPYLCKYCGRGFAEHGTLNRHLRAKVPCYMLPKDDSRSLLRTNTVPENIVLAPLDSEQTVTIDSTPTGNVSVTLMQETIAVQDGAAEDDAAIEPVHRDSQPQHPSMLTEFSTMVADTQQYILQGTDEVVTNSGNMEYVMVSSESISDPNEIPQSVEVVYDNASTKMELDSEITETDTQLVVVGEVEGGDLLLLNTQTGQTFQAPADAVRVSAQVVEDDEGTEHTV